jgi:hypothetical protein
MTLMRFLLQWVQSTSHFQSNRLLALNAGYTTNALGQTANAFTGLLATDVLNVKHLEKKTFRWN